MILVTVTSDELVYSEYWFPENYLRQVTGTLLHMENEARDVIA